MLNKKLPNQLPFSKTHHTGITARGIEAAATSWQVVLTLFSSQKPSAQI